MNVLAQQILAARTHSTALNAATNVQAFELTECPPLEFGARYVLARCGALGQKIVIGIGQAKSHNAIQNLAKVRFRGARAQAHEVYVIGRNAFAPVERVEAVEAVTS